MTSIRNLFLQNVAQTSELPLMLEIDRAEGMYIWDKDGKKYMDLNSGISVSSLGHRHPNIVRAIVEQTDKYLHTMVYGEHIQQVQVAYAKKLIDILDNGLDRVYYLMTGTEAVELAMKMARKYTGKQEIISCANAYHGSTMGAESLRSDYEFSRAFFPGVPGIRHIRFNEESDLEKISCRTAAVITEPVQAESGVQAPKNDYLKKLSARCKEMKCLLILDEIQTGFGRTGHWFAHKKYDVIPDLLLIAKSMGGGMPIGAVVAPQKIMKSIVKNPALGHITTFGGHPVSVASALATLETLEEDKIITTVLKKETIFRERLRHPIIREVRSSGLMMAVELERRKYLKHVVSHTIQNGALIDYFLFNNKSFRLAPPLIISEDGIHKACDMLLASCDYAMNFYKK
jgi:acetylornithine/succinyldiaminopimelate/putrescine aminotransferase